MEHASIYKSQRHQNFHGVNFSKQNQPNQHNGVLLCDRNWSIYHR